jgi:hypothetical protein
MPEIGKSGSMWRGLETEPSKSVAAPALDPAGPRDEGGHL